jgi:hypothetical protein
VSEERDGRRVSAALTEARTVLSRAETARAYVSHYHRDDPAAVEILQALSLAIEQLAPFRRVGRAPRE